ncbi:MAG: toprim domain-containing protein [Prevotellaceae bacterium]|jgi:hypothetical protein|nr:toprim domain-containing protein [Prevotellaceae bacterium]
MKYEKPQLFQPTPEDIGRVAKYLNSKLTTKRVTSVNGVPVDKNGNIKTTKPKVDVDVFKQISIKNFLKQNNIAPLRDGDSYGLYSAPYRIDKNPSMKVNYRDNTWYDFATSEHGDIIDLVRKINNTDFKGAVQVLQSQSGLTACETVVAPVQVPKEVKINVFKITELNNPALLQYLQERNINVAIAKKVCKELYYEVRTGEQSKRYFGIGFQNDKGGWEIRNKYFKGATSKDITTIVNSSNTCRMFEGFMDYLSFLTLSKQNFSNSEWVGNNGEDVLVLNSLAMVNKAKPFLAKHTANYCYLDNDAAGQRVLLELKKEKLSAIDVSGIYDGYKDLNEMHQSLPRKIQPKTSAKLKM